MPLLAQYSFVKTISIKAKAELYTTIFSWLGPDGCLNCGVVTGHWLCFQCFQCQHVVGPLMTGSHVAG